MSLSEKEIVKILALGNIPLAIEESVNSSLFELAERLKKSCSHTSSLTSYREYYKSSWDGTEYARGPGGAQANGFQLDQRQRAAADFIKASRSPSLLDVGCSDGSFLFTCLHESAVATAVGVDAWEEGIAFARSFAADNFPSATFHAALFEDVQFAPHESFGAIHLGEILEHVLDPVAVLKKSLTLLSPGGSIVVTVPVDVPCITEEDEFHYLKADRVNQHVRYIDKSALDHYASAAGLKVVDSAQFGQGWVNLIATLQRA